MTREGFHDSLERIELELLTMGELTSTAVQRAVQALVERDDELAQPSSTATIRSTSCT